ncbi:MAG: ComEC/Rec2 family competence protein [Bacteroidota bacterium]
MKKRFYSIVLCLLLVLSNSVLAEKIADRYDRIFDAAQDAGKLTVRFIKLTTRSEDKSGDCAIITSPDGKVMMIDAGNPSTFVDVDRALKALGITRIDYLVASHPHVDHVGNFAQLIRAYQIGGVYTSELVYPNQHYQNYQAAIKETGTPHIILAEGDSFKFGDNVLVEVFHPAPGIVYYDGYPAQSTQFINNLSLVLKLTYAKSSFLFGGDLYSIGEDEVVKRYGAKLDSDVFKVGHHGDATSSSKSYRNAISPQIAVMMHDAIADLNVYRKYRREGAATYITSIDGCVLVSTAGDGKYTVITQFDRKNNFLN